MSRAPSAVVRAAVTTISTAAPVSAAALCDDAIEAADIELDDITTDPPGLIDGDDPQGVGITRKRGGTDDRE